MALLFLQDSLLILGGIWLIWKCGAAHVVYASLKWQQVTLSAMTPCPPEHQQLNNTALPWPENHQKINKSTPTNAGAAASPVLFRSYLMRLLLGIKG